jgi:DNA-binding GntR family transcriptional regulator
VVAADGTGSAVPECPDPLQQASRLFATGVSFPAVESALSPARRRLFRRRGSVRPSQDDVSTHRPRQVGERQLSAEEDPAINENSARGAGREIGSEWGGVRETAREYAISQLRRAIRMGELQGGDVLREEEWSANLGISRTPLREAIAELVVEGLLRKEGRSVYVFRPSVEELFEIYDIREQLEALAARRAASRMTPEQAEQLKLLIEDISTVEPTDDWFARHEAFHMAIATASGMPRLASLIESLRTQSEPYVRLATSLDADFRVRAARQHRAIFELLVAGVETSAAREVRRHLRSTRNKMSELAKSGTMARAMGPRPR